jgi:anti-anti-sigma factor
MEITRKYTGGLVDLELAGRLDGYWSDHLTSALSEIVRGGEHHIRIDCSRVSFLSSAGIAVLMKFHKELGRISGSFHVVNASPPVTAVLRMTRLDTHLIARPGPATPQPIEEHPARRFERDGISFGVFDLEESAVLACRAMGTAAPLAECAFTADQSTSLAGLAPTLVVGVGAFGDSFADCQARFGELLSVAGATAYQPADGTNVPDYLVAHGALGADIRVLYCLVCDGHFSHLVRFETLQADATVTLSALLAGCFEAAPTESLGIVVVSEAAGLVGAALRRSPAQPVDKGGLFDHPAVRTRLTFTAERAFARSVALVAGVVTRPGLHPDRHDQLRPIGREYDGHLHAAAFRFRPIRKGPIDFRETVTNLFEADQLLGVVHLLHDDRGAAGAGESEFVRGACWVGPIDWSRTH